MQLIKNIRQQSRNIVREFGFLRKSYEDTDISYQETHSLIELARLGSLEVGELATLLQLDKSVASRMLKKMYQKKWVKLIKDEDGRKKTYALTALGKKIQSQIETTADDKMEKTLNELSPDEQEKVQEGLALFAKALKVSRVKSSYVVRPIQAKDDKAMEKIVRECLDEMGFEGPGTAAADPTLSALSKNFTGKGQVYFVLEKDGVVYGGAGITPLIGGSKNTCELIRMFLAPEQRGTGAGQLLMDKCLKAAKEMRYKSCYLETTPAMKAAQRLYTRNGFQYLKKRKGNTGHFACNVTMECKL